jgi:hypothetical protein
MTAADTTTLMHWEVIVICNNSLCVLGKFSRSLRLCRIKAFRASPPDQIYLARYIASDPCSGDISHPLLLYDRSSSAKVGSLKYSAPQVVTESGCC